MYNDGSELQEELTTYQTDFRMLDPALGRWWQVDPVHKYHESPYAWVTNNPIRWNDPLGLDTVRHGDNNVDFEKDVVLLDEVTVEGENESDDDDSDSGGTNAVATVTPIALGSAVIDGPIPVGDAIAIIIMGGAVIYDIYTQPESVVVPLHNPDGILTYTPPPKTLPGFPGATRARPKGGRARWVTPDGDILEWDSQHGDVEVYDKRGRHRGSADPDSGEMIKDPVPGRKIDP